MAEKLGAPSDGRGLPRKRLAEVVEAAVHTFSEKGYLATTMEDVADRVGVLKGSLYYYVASKEDLLERIFEDINVEGRAILEDVVHSDGGPLERMYRYVSQYLLWYLSNFERVKLYFSEWRHLGGERRSRVLAQRAEFEVFVRDLVAEAQEQGLADSTLDAKRTAFFILSAVNSVYTWYRPDGPDGPDSIAESYAQMAVGLLVGSRPPT